MPDAAATRTSRFAYGFASRPVTLRIAPRVRPVRSMVDARRTQIPPVSSCMATTRSATIRPGSVVIVPLTLRSVPTGWRRADAIERNGGGVGVGLGVALGFGVAVGLGVPLGVGVGAGAVVGATVGVAAVVGIDVGVGSAVGLGVDSSVGSAVGEAAGGSVGPELDVGAGVAATVVISADVRRCRRYPAVPVPPESRWPTTPVNSTRAPGGRSVGAIPVAEAAMTRSTEPASSRSTANPSLRVLAAPVTVPPTRTRRPSTLSPTSPTRTMSGDRAIVRPVEATSSAPASRRVSWPYRLSTVPSATISVPTGNGTQPPDERYGAIPPVSSSTKAPLPDSVRPSGVVRVPMIRAWLPSGRLRAVAMLTAAGVGLGSAVGVGVDVGPWVGDDSGVGVGAGVGVGVAVGTGVGWSVGWLSAQGSAGRSAQGSAGRSAQGSAGRSAQASVPALPSAQGSPARSGTAWGTELRSAQGSPARSGTAWGTARVSPLPWARASPRTERATGSQPGWAWGWGRGRPAQTSPRGSGTVGSPCLPGCCSYPARCRAHRPGAVRGSGPPGVPVRQSPRRTNWWRFPRRSRRSRHHR